MSSSSHAVHADRPERSRNAKAQARHRAKRKAYIEQLEQTVTKMQLASGFSQDQISILPPPLLKIRELEQENGRLQKENDELRKVLTDTNHTTKFASDSIRRQPVPAYQDFRGIERDYKPRRKEGLYISPSDTPPHITDLTPRAPPPLSVPQPVSHHYGHLNTSSASHGHSGQTFDLPDTGTGFQLPNTPSESSATSSPPFSPLQIQHPLHSSLDHRPHLSNHHPQISNSYAHSTGHYSAVKIEDDHYLPAHQTTMHYSYTNGHSHTHNGLDWQGGYSSERGHLQR